MSGVHPQVLLFRRHLHAGRWNMESCSQTHPQTNGPPLLYANFLWECLLPLFWKCKGWGGWGGAAERLFTAQSSRQTSIFLLKVSSSSLFLHFVSTSRQNKKVVCFMFITDMTYYSRVLIINSSSVNNTPCKTQIPDQPPVSRLLTTWRLLDY